MATVLGDFGKAHFNYSIQSNPFHRFHFKFFRFLTEGMRCLVFKRYLFIFSGSEKCSKLKKKNIEIRFLSTLCRVSQDSFIFFVK